MVGGSGSGIEGAVLEVENMVADFEVESVEAGFQNDILYTVKAYF